MRELSECKLLGYYLIKQYEKLGLSELKYEQVKLLTESIFKKLNTNSYVLVPLENKNAIIKSMINKGVFKTCNVNGKNTFSQKYNYEFFKYITAHYSPDGNLVFKLSKEINLKDNAILSSVKSTYSNLNLDITSIANFEIANYLSKTYSNTKTRCLY